MQSPATESENTHGPEFLYLGELRSSIQKKPRSKKKAQSMITRRDLLVAVRSFPTWASAEQVHAAIPQAEQGSLTATSEMLDRLVRDRALSVDNTTASRRYAIRQPKTRAQLPIELIAPGIEKIEKAGLGTGFLLGMAISLAYSKDSSSRAERIALLLERWLARAKAGTEAPIPLSVMSELIALQNKSPHMGIHAAVNRIKDVYEGRTPLPLPGIMKYDAHETSCAVRRAVCEQDPRLIPSWIVAHVPDGAEQVLALFSACRGTLEFSKRFLVRAAVHVAHAELRRPQRAIAEALRVKVDTVRLLLDDLATGGSLCDRGDARPHQLQIVGALKALAYTEQAIEVVCALRAMHALQGNMTQSSKYIGITRAALDRWLAAYGLERIKNGVYGECPL